MREIYLSDVRHIEVRQAEVPRPGAGEALIKVAMVGICGSDLHIYLGEHPFVKPPVVPGHEVWGTVEQLGPDTQGCKIGDRVAVMPQLYCGECGYCRNGDYHLCAHMKVLGAHTAGAMRDYMTVPANLLIPLSAGLAASHAAMIEPVAVAVHAARRFGDVEGKRLLVSGAGVIGNLTAQVVLSLGAADVAITDIRDKKLSVARQCGIPHCVNTEAGRLADKVPELFGELGPDGIFECTGAEAAVDQCIAAARKNSTIVQVGVCPGMPRVHLASVQKFELTITGSMMYKQPAFSIAAQLVETGKLDLYPLVTRVFPLEQAAEAYEYILSDPQNCLKVLLDATQ